MREGTHKRYLCQEVFDQKFDLTRIKKDYYATEEKWHGSLF